MGTKDGLPGVVLALPLCCANSSGFDHREPRDAASGHCVFEAPAHLFLQEGAGCGLRTVCASFKV